MEHLSERIERDGITLDLESGEPSEGMGGHPMHDYRATLTYDGRTMTTGYHTGMGWTRDPSAADVLDSLLSDASAYDNSDGFEDWADGLGMDADPRLAKRIYKAVREQTEQLRSLLGDQYAAYLYETERL